jgi:competence/damage-inducible protein CinA-like protein
VKPLSRAAIIAVGSELLTSSRVDTNSLFITEQLNVLGIDVALKSVIGDDREELAHAFRGALERVDLVVFSGGLGPTDDDVTRDAVSAVLRRPLREDEGLTERLRARFVARGFKPPMPENNRRQAMVPEGAQIIENAFGSAPGLWLEAGERVVVLLPGPPRELKPMLTGLVEGRLRERSPGVSLVRRVIKIAGRIESQVDETLQPLYRRWEQSDPPISATILAALGQIELHLSARAASSEAASRALEGATQQVIEALGSDVFSSDGRSLEAVVGDLLVERGMQIAVAESCTGGLITSRLTDVAGSSRYVQRSVVVYSNESKTELLGVPAELIAEHGAVSEPVAAAMAEGVRIRARADIGVGVTGIAGPTGGTPEKPVGMVVVAASRASGTCSRTFRFLGERDRVKFQASQAALDMVRRMLIESGKVEKWKSGKVEK